MMIHWRRLCVPVQTWVFKGDVAANVRHITEKIHNIKKELD